MKKHLLTCWLVFLASYQAVMADDLGQVYMADANVQCAWIYGIAIVVAGITIGTGLFFGLKSRKRE